MSTSPRTGIPSIVSWPEMGGATAHPTGATLALGDPSVSLNAPQRSWSCHRPQGVPTLAPGWPSGLLLCLLPQQALQQSSGRTAVCEVPLFIAEEAPHRPSVWPSLSPKIRRLFSLIIKGGWALEELRWLSCGHGW